MYYVLLCEYVERTVQQRQGALPAHLARLQAPADQGRLLCAGPYSTVDTEETGQAGFPSTLNIAEFDTFKAATA